MKKLKNFDEMIEIASRIRGIDHLTVEEQRDKLAHTLAFCGMTLPEYVAIHNRDGKFNKKD